jgi:hypothetical protein
MSLDTGLAPQDDKVTNMTEPWHYARCHLPFCWAQENWLSVPAGVANTCQTAPRLEDCESGQGCPGTG